MLPKYAGKTIALPKEVADRLLAVQAKLIEQLGFQPSLSEVVACILKNWESQQTK